MKDKFKKQLSSSRDGVRNKLALRREATVPRITNDNVAEHREDVLAGARKYIYPLQHSKHRIVLLSTTLVLLAITVFSITSVLFLYRFKTDSAFYYQITRVLPFPIARTGPTFVAYENYLFELNHYVHYYQNQQQLSFDSEFGQAQLQSYRERAINKVINDAYVKIIAEENGIIVSEAEIDEQIRIAREQNRLGGSEEIFEDVLREYWNWSITDFRRSLQAELLTQKVIRALESGAERRAIEALSKLEAGVDFATLAKEYSDDLGTKEVGGDFGEVTRSNRNVSQQTVDALFALEAGQNSGIIIVPYGTGYALEIVQNVGEEADKVRGAHIIFQLKGVDEILNDRKEAQPYRLYMNPVSN